MNPNNDDIVISSVSEYLNQIIYNLQNANSITADDSVVMEKTKRKITIIGGASEISV